MSIHFDPARGFIPVAKTQAIIGRTQALVFAMLLFAAGLAAGFTTAGGSSSGREGAQHAISGRTSAPAPRTPRQRKTICRLANARCAG